jgi:glycosyltransferase involved in cell wall biosynthesis
MSERVLLANRSSHLPPHPRVFLISYHFPPDRTVGARRWEKLAHFFTERGWGVDVITHDGPEHDPDRMAALPEDMSVYAIPDTRQMPERMEDLMHAAYRALHHTGASADTAASGNDKVAALDSRPQTLDRNEMRRTAYTTRGVLRAYWAWRWYERHISWARAAAQLAVRLRRPEHFVVITSGPPHMTHEGGRLLSVRTGLPLVMDMRDPWSLSPRIYEGHASPLWYRLAERYEKAAIERAALIVANTAPARDALAERYPARRDDMIAVMNGADDDPLPPSTHTSRFVIRYAGTIYTRMDPLFLLRGVARVVRELQLAPAEFGVDFLGAFDGPGQIQISAIAQSEGLADFVTVTPRQPHAKAMEFMAGATMLITFAGWSTITIPAKTFECMRFDAWLLALSDRGSANDLLLRDTDADSVDTDDIDAIAAAIRRRYQAFRRGERPVHIAQDERFSRRTQAGILLDAIARLLPQPDRRRDLATRS